MTFVNIVNSVVSMALIAVLLFVPAGTWNWPQGWVFFAEMILGAIAVTWWLARRDPGLLKERMSGAFQKGQSFADRVFMVFMVLAWYGWTALMALDAVRWQTSHIPVALNVVGALLIAIGFVIVVRVFRENTFAAPVIRIQEERGQHVIDTGPYALVRHPMYAGAIVYMLGMPLLLGSWLGLLVFPAIVLALCLRTFIEEAALRKGIAGYDAYMQRVRFRLVPGVW